MRQVVQLFMRKRLNTFTLKKSYLLHHCSLIAAATKEVMFLAVPRLCMLMRLLECFFYDLLVLHFATAELM